MLLWYPALVPSVLQQFVVCFPLLIFNYANATLFSLAKVFHLYWILLLVPSSVPSAIDKFQLALVSLLPRPRLCVSWEFLVFRCLRLFLAQLWLGTALARQIPSLLPSLSPMLPPFPLAFLPPLFPFPRLLPRELPLSLDALPLSSLS